MDFPRPLRARCFWPSAAAAVLALVLIPFAKPVHRAVYDFLMWLPLEEFFSTSKQLAGATCVAAILLSIWILDRPRRRAVIVFLVALSLSSALNETIKQITGRARPTRSVLLDDNGMKKVEAYIAAHPGTPVRAAREDQWLLLKPGRPWFKSDYASCPTGHSNTAFLLAAFLLTLYPRGRWVWLILAAGCALARVRFRRHFPSDILMGSALGWAMAWWAFSWRWPARLADAVFLRFPFLRGRE